MLGRHLNCRAMRAMMRVVYLYLGSNCPRAMSRYFASVALRFAVGGVLSKSREDDVVKHREGKAPAARPAPAPPAMPCHAMPCHAMRPRPPANMACR